MRAPVSIVIPTLDAEQDLPATLAALAEGLDAGLIRELILSDGGSVDGTIALGEMAGAEIVTGATGRGAQLARGAQAASGEWIFFLHADTWLDEGWADAVLRHIGSSQKAGYFRLKFRSDGIASKLVAGWANLRSRWFGLPYGDQGLLISRTQYDAVGGYQDIPLMEDVAMARSLRGAIAPLRVSALTSAEKYHNQGWLRRGASNLWTLLRYYIGADPEKLAQSYNRKRP